jgi:hypothetical protein
MLQFNQYVNTNHPVQQRHSGTVDFSLLSSASSSTVIVGTGAQLGLLLLFLVLTRRCVDLTFITNTIISDKSIITGSFERNEERRSSLYCINL